MEQAKYLFCKFFDDTSKVENATVDNNLLTIDGKAKNTYEVKVSVDVPEEDKSQGYKILCEIWGENLVKEIQNKQNQLTQK